ncbi:MAG: TauD/TfdA family dioxygenase [Alphaproteobacteria bacterium]|nr:TauD/TfdA family dioxygenase [Alphaproteobacteria bacterium]
MTIEPLCQALGAEVRGVDLRRPLDPATVKALYRAFNERYLLLFRGQQLEAEDQVRFAELFGPVAMRAPAMQKTGQKFLFVSNAREGGVLGDGELHFHQDNTFFEVPLKAVCLYAIEVPSAGGDTQFSNCGLAYDRAPQAFKDRIAGLHSLQMFDYDGDYNSRPDESASGPNVRKAVQPLVWQHPETGRKVLFCSYLTAARIVELDKAKGDALLDEIVRHLSDPALMYRHRWTPGDLIIWDNRALQHARTTFDPKERRTLRRVPVAEDFVRRG